MTRLAFVTLLLAAGLLGACGDDEPSGAARPDRATPPTVAERAAAERRAPARRGTTVKVVNSQFGRILADGRGHAFYYFDKEKTRTSRCYGDCAKAWPPVYAKGRPVAGKGARASLIGTLAGATDGGR
jgi:hypothetical protein